MNAEQAIGAPAAMAARAMRDTRGRYPADQLKRLAVDDSVLDQRSRGSEDYAWSSSWLKDGSCCTCLRPECRRFVCSEMLWCPEHGRQRIPAEDPWPMGPEERRAAEDRVWPRIATRFGIGSRYRNYRLEDSDPTPALREMRDFLDDDENRNRCLVLAGPTGVGKTHAMIAAFREESVWTCAEGLAVYFSMAALARALLGDDRDEVLESCLEADLLAVDDVGGGVYVKEGGLVETLVEQILIDREANALETWMTTNMTLQAFTSAMGDRVADRILRGEWGTWCSFEALGRAAADRTTHAARARGARRSPSECRTHGRPVRVAPQVALEGLGTPGGGDVAGDPARFEVELIVACHRVISFHRRPDGRRQSSRRKPLSVGGRSVRLKANSFAAVSASSGYRVQYSCPSWACLSSCKSAHATWRGDRSSPAFKSTSILPSWCHQISPMLPPALEHHTSVKAGSESRARVGERELRGPCHRGLDHAQPRGALEPALGVDLLGNRAHRRQRSCRGSITGLPMSTAPTSPAGLGQAVATACEVRPV